MGFDWVDTSQEVHPEELLFAGSEQWERELLAGSEQWERKLFVGREQWERNLFAGSEQWEVKTVCWKRAVGRGRARAAGTSDQD